MPPQPKNTARAMKREISIAAKVRKEGHSNFRNPPICQTIYQTQPISKK